jgi:hypothetical protein
MTLRTKDRIREECFEDDDNGPYDDAASDNAGDPGDTGDTRHVKLGVERWRVLCTPTNSATCTFKSLESPTDANEAASRAMAKVNAGMSKSIAIAEALKELQRP